MKQLSQRIQNFTHRYPWVGPSLWIFCLQYYLIQVVVALSFKMHYSILHNTISDLGNTACRIYASRYVCSPLHVALNLSTVILGLFMTIGSILIYHEVRRNRGTLVGFSFLAIAGAGTILVGLFPENTTHNLHKIGALLPFLIGNIAILILGFALAIPLSLRIYTILTGIISLTALGFYVNHIYLGLGIGGMERFVANPHSTWLIVFGLYFMIKRSLERKNSFNDKHVIGKAAR